ncbi:MAG: hypothetical protein U5R46_16555 [Gammaproteobacteria bacterium]|nr:hypothetical protein [Gammaproteobacteria bacterium]
MADNTTQQDQNEPRRRLIKALASGGGIVATGSLLPTSWRTPVIDSVVLPGHAQTSCSPQDDEYDLNPGESTGSVPAPGVLENESCQTVTDFGNLMELEGGSVTSLNVNADGSFDYEVSERGTRFSFEYTTESGETATVIVNHDFNISPP